MKIKLLLTTLFFGAQVTFAQQMINENFDSYNVGNVGTDLTGNVAGQGGWKTLTLSGGNLSNFKFDAEAGKGNILTVISANTATTAQNNNAGYVFKGFPSNAWTGRTNGNNVLRIEYEFYTGMEGSSLSNHRNIVSSANNVIAGCNYDPKTRILSGLTRYNNQGQVGLFLVKLGQKGGSPADLVLPDNTWVKVYYQLDYSTNKVNYQIPSLNIKEEISTVSLATEIPVEIGFMTYCLNGNTAASTVMYDNLTVAAVGTTQLAIHDVVSERFKLYPNPVSDIVMLTNDENIGMEQVAIIDLGGRTLRTYELNQQTGIQLNISDLPAGIYIVNIKTKEGMASKKIIKK